MKPSILFVITGDPRSSGRPAEGIRIAAGVGSWKKADILVYLHGAAVLALSPLADEWVDGDCFVRYLPLIAEFGRPVYIQENAPMRSELAGSPVEFEELNLARLASMAAEQSYVARF